MKQRTLKVIKICAVILAVGCVYTLILCYSGKGIPCVFHLLTGLLCPGCGISRMCISLIKLDFVSAFRYNQAVFCMIPLFIFLFARYIYSYIRYNKKSLSKAEDILQYAMIAVLIAFGIIRNII